MDRHDLAGATAESVAQAHVLDLGSSAKHGVQFLSYWFDAAKGAAFCLADAPAPEAMQAVHRRIARPDRERHHRVSEDDVLRFLGRIREPADASQVDSAFRTILFTDMQGSTALLHAVGEPAYLVLLTEHDLIIRRAVAAARGREVKHTGDGVMASFEEVGLALGCAAAIQDGFDARTAGGASPDMRVRIGIAAGEPVDHNDDIFGATVNLASRLCAAAEAGHILVSGLVRDLGSGEGFAFERGGRATVAWVPDADPGLRAEPGTWLTARGPVRPGAGPSAGGAIGPSIAARRTPVLSSRLATSPGPRCVRASVRARLSTLEGVDHQPRPARQPDDPSPTGPGRR